MSSTSSVTSTSSSVRPLIIREQYTAALAKSIELEKNGDRLTKLGRFDLAMKEYNKSIQIEQAYVGQHHPIVSSYQDKLLEKYDSLKRIQQRADSVALSKSLQLEKEGDKLQKQGKNKLAQRKYEKSYTIETAVLGADHPMVSSLEQKIVISLAA